MPCCPISEESRAASSPWGRAIVPMEMISVLVHKLGPSWPVRTPSLGLFLDLEIRLVNGPVFVDHDYRIERELADAEAAHDPARIAALHDGLHAIDGYSAHADHNGLLAWLKMAQERGNPRQLFLVHGEMEGATAVAEAARQQGIPEVHIPARGEAFTL